ncbi:MAG: HAMP domain-containing histidine kinase [Chloroflexota bacterium]|nr:HAMP domain-containing histidine kinase [Chloroflexota bacterium]
MSGSLPGQPAADARLMRRVRRRLVAWSAGSTLVLLLVLGSALYFSVDASLAASGLTQLNEQAAAVRGFVTRSQGPGPTGGEHRDPPIGRPEFGGPGSGTISIVVDPSGAFVGGQPADTTDLPVAAGVDAARAGAVDIRLASVNGAPVRVRSEEVQVDGAPRIIQVIQDRTAEQRTLTTLLLMLVGGGLAALAVAAAFGFLYAGRALVPIRESLRRQREFTADASHELRTPLTIVRASVEHLRRHRDRPVAEVGDALGDIESEVGHLTDLVDDLLLLARSDSEVIQLRREPVDLAEVAGEALQRLRGQAEARGVKLRLDAAPAQVSGDADRLRQVVAILIDNAIRHSPAGGTVMVSINGEGRPRVSVEDEGGGIKSDDLPHVFDRFWRAADAPSGGTGLGLTIAAWIAEHHGGAIIPSNRPSGGACFELQLPHS